MIFHHVAFGNIVWLAELHEREHAKERSTAAGRCRSLPATVARATSLSRRTSTPAQSVVGDLVDNNGTGIPLETSIGFELDVRIDCS
jgi:hypothetical protein